jgi:ribosomal protein L29
MKSTDVTAASYDDRLLPEEGETVPIELTQTIVNAVLLLIVAFVGGALGLRRFEAIERSVAELRTDMKTDIAELRTEVKTDIAELRAEVKNDIAELRTDVKADLAKLRGEQAQMRSDLTYVALAVGARPAQGSG